VGGLDFALKLPELLNTSLVTFKEKLGQMSSCPNGPQMSKRLLAITGPNFDAQLRQ